jgi:hypothetical protein
MSIISRFERKLKELKASINPTIQETINRTKPLLIDEQTNGQMYKGEDSEGKQFVPSYALSTRVIKRKKGQPTNRVTLKDSGDLYKSIKIDAKTNDMIISANVEYFKYLVTHYDQNTILGLQPEFLEQYTKQVILKNLKRKWIQIIKS